MSLQLSGHIYNNIINSVSFLLKLSYVLNTLHVSFGFATH